MTNKQIIESMPKGGIVTSKQLLSALKKKGLIYGYSEYGYLESRRMLVLYDLDTNDYSTSYNEIFPNGNAQTCRERFKDYEELYDEIGSGNIKYMGVEFRTKYLDGCFQPYLERVTANEKLGEAKPRMSVFGAIV